MDPSSSTRAPSSFLFLVSGKNTAFSSVFSNRSNKSNSFVSELQLGSAVTASVGAVAGPFGCVFLLHTAYAALALALSKDLAGL